MSAQVANPSIDKTTELQSKLYQAARRDRSRRFHALYDKLSLPYVLQSAWEQVRANRGTAGVDGQSIAAIESSGVAAFLQETAQAVRQKTYRPQPVRRVLIPKGDGRTRPLGIPTVRDRVVQAAAKLLLEPIFEADFEECSFGFRPGIGQHQALEAIAENARKGYRWVVDADIESFFDTLEHARLMQALRRRLSDGSMLGLIYRWLKAGYLLDGELHDTDRGSPQGGVLSPLLANVYLHAFDCAHRQQKSFIGRLTRYADDFVIQCGTQAHAQRAVAWAQSTVEGLGLRLHPQKTRIVCDREAGFDFLGFYHRRRMSWHTSRETHGVSRWPSAKACQKFRQHVRALLGSCGRVRLEWGCVRRELTAYLRGWCQYFRHGQSSATLAKLDYFVLERVARNFARSQPTGKRRRRRHWAYYAQRLRAEDLLPQLTKLAQGSFRPYQGQANVRWRAVSGRT